MPRKKGCKTVSFTYKGKRHYASGKNDKEAAVNADRMLTKLQNDELITGGNTLVSVWAEYIIGVYKTDIKEVTRKKYVSRMNHCVLEYMGDMQLDGVTESTVNRSVFNRFQFRYNTWYNFGCNKKIPRFPGGITGRMMQMWIVSLINMI